MIKLPTLFFQDLVHRLVDEWRTGQEDIVYFCLDSDCANKRNFRVSWRGARKPLLSATDSIEEVAKRAAGQWASYRQHIAKYHCR